MAAKRKSMSFDMKLKIIEEVEQKSKSKAEICRQYGIASSTLSTFLANKEKIRENVLSGSSSLKKKRSNNHQDVDDALHIWFTQARANDVPISGPLLIEKGEEIAKSLGLTDFKMSHGWIDRFKARHQIKCKVVSGEAASAKNIDITNWDTTLKEILENYEPRNIYNADETGLFYKCLPNKSLCFEREVCTGQKVPKNRISLLLAANMDGTDKLPLLCIGKYENPRCFKNIRTLPVTYKHNKKAWMTSVIFEEWLRKLDRKMTLQGRSIAMIVDNCSAHPHIDGLVSIKLVFLPPNTTSKLQPCDQGIIKTFKTLYRKRVLKKFISEYDDTGRLDTHFKLTILDALFMCASSWRDVKTETVMKCFQHAGFEVDNTTCTRPTPSHEYEPDRDEETRNLFDQFSTIVAADQLDVDLDQYLTIDENIITAADMSIQDIVKSIEEKSEDQDESDEEVTPVISSKAVKQSLELIKAYVAQQPNGEEGLQTTLKLENIINTMTDKTRKQSRITSFFTKQS